MAPACALAATARPDVVDTSIAEADGGPILRQSIVIKTPRTAVWRAFTTTEGLRAWESPVVAIDLKVGCMMEDSYDPKGKLGDPGNIKNEILGFLPEELLVMRNVQSPPDFTYKDAFQRMTTLVQFEGAGEGLTRVTVSIVGFDAGRASEALYRFFGAGDAYELEALKAYLEGTPAPAE